MSEEKDGTENFVVTTDDAPVVEPVEPAKPDQPEETPAKVEEDKVQEKEQEPEKKDGEETEEATGADAAAKPEKKSGFQKRINKEVRRRSEAEQRADKAERELAQLKAEKETPAEKKEPVESDFESYDDYLDALDAFEKETPAEPEKKEEPAADPDAAELTDSQKVAMTVVKESIDGAEVPEDFDEVALDPSVPITGDMLEALAECDDPAKVMYHLGQNKDVAKEIAESSTAKQMMAIKELDMTVKVIPAKPVQTTETPDPITPVGGSDAQKKAPSEMSFSEYEKEMNERERGGSKAGW